jgi:hypothetical protein
MKDTADIEDEDNGDTIEKRNNPKHVVRILTDSQPSKNEESDNKQQVMATLPEKQRKYFPAN